MFLGVNDGYIYAMPEGYYKIKPEIRDFIVKEAGECPRLGCRKLANLIQEKFGLEVSKSSISAILKLEGLNKAAGRPRTRSLVIPIEDNKEILALRFILEDQTIFYLDAGFQSIWPTNHIPQTFSQGLVRLKGELERVILFNQQPLVLLAAPGFQAPASTFLDFLVCFKGDDSHKALKCIELYTRDGELLEVIQPIPIQKRHFLIGLWPWQYKKAACPLFLRKVVWQRDSQEILTVLTNMDEALAKDDEIIELYLRRWPEPQESYQEFLNKITASLSLGKDFPRK